MLCSCSGGSHNMLFFFLQAEDGIRDTSVTGVQTCALPISARAACDLPALRKDFVIDTFQVYESRAMGADCILLIVAALELSQMRDLEAAAVSLDMAVLAEVHDRAELDLALELATPPIGSNNRDLHSFETRLETTLGSSPRIGPPRIAVSESGILSAAHAPRLRHGGVQVSLV